MNSRTSIRLFLWVACLLLTFAQAEAQKSKPKPKSKSTASRKKYPAKKPVVKPVKPISTVLVSNPTVIRTQAAFSFTNRWFDFGDIVQGQKVSHTFVFRNTGRDPLVIHSIQPTCGCTVAEWTKNPIPPGQSGEIIITFDSKEALNQQSKVITIVSNVATGTERLYVKGNVLPRR